MQENHSHSGFNNAREFSKAETTIALLWLEGDITNERAAERLGTRTTAVYQRIAAILRTAVREGRIKVRSVK